MIISVSILYFFGNAVDSLDPLIELFGVDLYNDMPFYILVGNAMLFGSHGLYSVIYYNFCKEYKRIFDQTVLCRKPEPTNSGLAGSTSIIR